MDTNILGMLQSLMGLQQQQQQMQEGQQHMQFAPQRAADEHAVAQGQAQHYQDESAMAPFNQSEAQFTQDHRGQMFDQSALAAKLHALAGLGSSAAFLTGLDPTEQKSYVHQQLGLPGDPVGDELRNRIKSKFGLESDVYKKLATP